MPQQSSAIAGSVAVGFERVRDAFVESFARRGELGGACCVYRYDEKVVDLWGGVRDRESDEPWHTDTMVVVHSATKGMAAIVMALCHSRGWLDYDARVAQYWPEFAQAGKEHTTVRQLLAHQAGLYAFDEPVVCDVIADLDRLAIMARQCPAWPPGERQAYHAISLGFYQGELLRRVDPGHRSLGRFFAEEIAAPLGLEFYLRLPASLSDGRLAPMEAPSRWAMLLGLPLPVMLDAFRPRSVLYRALMANPGTGFYADPQRVYVRELEAPAVPSRHGFFDECLHAEVPFSLGFMKPNAGFAFGSASAFGAPGAGGAMGYADPESGIGYGYVTNRMGTHFAADPRDVALRDALARCAPH
jgi:CubicO group peptidase (beta-lactamase class C family)